MGPAWPRCASFAAPRRFTRNWKPRLPVILATKTPSLFPAAFDANGGLFEPLLDDKDAIVSDSLNHASIIDGVRLCKAKRYRFPNGDMTALEDSLKQCACRWRAQHRHRHRRRVFDGRAYCRSGRDYRTGRKT